MMAMNFKFRVPKFLKSVRYSLAAVNGLFLLTGLLLLLVGIAVLVKYTAYDELITNRFTNLAGFVIATGIIILLGTVLGFYGAISQQFYFIIGYVILMLVVLVFEVAIVIVAFALSNSAESDIGRSMAQSRLQYGSRVEITQIWDDLQMGFQCCGVTGRFDWSSSQIPVSCCFIDYGTVSPFECTTANAYTEGCARMLGEYLAYQAHVVAVCALVATCIQILLTAFSGFLAWRSRSEEVELES
ncbi:leukocyte surface antigen CD53-like [Anticarsia gemmatalis]|uniref:leukocyte surface antigen CD53-like n=1 Tax=Anticarsia gemmatalis TaxID=129554 RepID=UPI003F758F1E